MSKVEFSWVYQPAVRPGEDGSSLLAENDRFIEKLAPHIHAVWVEDHFQWDDRAMVECWTTLSYLAGKHPNLVLAPLVLGQSYRNPALTAKMAATIHYLTGGRFVMGLGAGWKEDEYRAYGWDYPAPRTRIEQLEDTLAIVKAMWSNAPATYEGKHYSIHNAYCEPRPNPMPPIMIGGGGEKYLLPVVARHADWWNVPFTTLDVYKHKLSLLDGYCRDISRDPASLRKTYFGFVSLVRDPEKVVKREGLHIIGGTPEQVTAELQSFVDNGIDYFILRLMDFPSHDGLDMFLSEVMPHFR